MKQIIFYNIRKSRFDFLYNINNIEVGDFMGNIVGVEKHGYTYRGEFYEYRDYRNLNEKLGSNREIVILGEPLLVKVYNFEENKNSLEKFIEEIIIKDFSVGDDLLFHYDFMKGINKVYVYSIKKGIAVEKIIDGAKSISVIPIQFKIKELINNKLKRYRNFISISKIRDIYYLINVEDGVIINGLVDENIDNAFKELSKYIKINKEVIFDRSINIDMKNEIEDIKEIQYLKIGETINEKLFKKQKFYTKKLY